MIESKEIYLISKKTASGVESGQKIFKHLNRKGQAEHLAFYRYVLNANDKQHKMTFDCNVILAFSAYRINKKLRRYETKFI